MLPASVAIVLTGLMIGLLALAAFVWAWRHGQFDDIEAQAYAVFEERDHRLARPWETEAQRDERARRYGPLERPAPGEWGGAA